MRRCLVQCTVEMEWHLDTRLLRPLRALFFFSVRAQQRRAVESSRTPILYAKSKVLLSFIAIATAVVHHPICTFRLVV